MRLAIKNRAAGKFALCHLCRKEIKYALKIEVPLSQMTKGFDENHDEIKLAK